MLYLIRGRANTGKSSWVLKKIRERGLNTDTPHRQILLVPDHASFAAEKDLCEACGAAGNRYAEVLTFSRMSHRVLEKTGGFEKFTLDNGGKVLTMQRVLQDLASELRVYHRPSQKVSFLRQFIDLVEELERYSVSPDALVDYAKTIGDRDERDKMRDIALIYGAYFANLSRYREGGVDLTDEMAKLNARLIESGYVKDADVYLDGFAYFTRQEERTIELMLSQAHSVSVTLLGEKNSRQECFYSGDRTYENLRRTAELSGHAVVTEELVRCGGDTALEHLEKHFFGSTKSWQGICEMISICEATTLYSEAEQAASQIRTLVASGKYRYRDIGVAVRNMDDYEAVVESIFRRYEVPIYTSRRSDLMDKPLVTLIISSLQAVTGGYEYEDMFRYLKSGLAGISDEACDILENYVLKWDIRGNMWIRDAAWTANPEGYVEGMDEAQRERLTEVNRIREQVRVPLKHLAEALSAGESAGEKMTALYCFFEEIDLPRQLQAHTESLTAAGELQLADEYRQLWELICHVMDQFVEILGDRALEKEEFVRLLKLVITQYSVGTIPATLDQVSFDQISMNDRHRVKCLFLLGCNDHVLPAVGNGGAILTEEEREALSDGGIRLSPFGMDQMQLELQNIYAALVRPQEQLIVSYPTQGANGTELRPAFIVPRLLKLFPSLQIQRGDKTCRLTAPVPALEMAAAGRTGALWQYYAASPAWTEAVAAVERGAGMRRGKLGRGAVESLYGRSIRMSASKIDKVSSCHFAYFMQYGLRARERKSAGLDPAQIGTFLHYVLEHVTKEAIARGGFAKLSKKELKSLTRQHMDAYIASAIGNVDEKEARFRYLLRRLRRTVDTVMENVAEEMTVSDFVPLAFELEFGGEGPLDAITIREGNAELSVVGKVDRVDGWLKDGRLYLRVVDYKTGKKSFDLTDIYHGINVQMLLYLFALEREGKNYFGHDIVPAGVLYLPARDVVLNMDRTTDAETLRRCLDKELRRSGLLLQDREVLSAMEHDALTEPRYLPLALDKDHNITKGIATAEQLGRLSRYVDELLHQVAREISSGNIDADPCYYSEAENACTYCEFASACHFGAADREEQPRYIYPVKNDEFWARLSKTEREEETHG